jgi:hypothetical protein
MTYDKIIAKMDDFNVGLSNGFGDVKTLVQFVNALRAVVELHKPIETTPPWGGDKYTACNVCEVGTNEGDYKLDYPCSTIQVIEKELM